MTEPLPKTVYRVDDDRSGNVYACVAILCVVPLIFLFGENYRGQWVPALVACAAVLPCIALLIGLARHVRFIMDDTGCELVSPGSSVRVSWSEVEYISIASGLLGVVLKKPHDSKAMRRQAWLVSLPAFDPADYSVEHLMLIDELRFMDLNVFEERVRTAGFVQRAAGYPVVVTGDPEHHSS